ncbi:MAG: hypothetical protein KKD44_27730 [Proteobacteria bacterium]|nr:hypothetical protein [Pseudomonadota bacterium]
MNKTFNKILLSVAIVAMSLNIAGSALPAYAEAGTVVKRSFNSNHISNGDGSITASIAGKWVNYMNESDEWTPINVNFVDVGTHFEMKDAPFTALAPKLSTGTATFISNNRYDIFKKEKIEDEPLIMTTTAEGVTEVGGVIETGDLGWGETTYIIYKGAYPDLNADLIFVVHNGAGTRLTRLIKINSNPNLSADAEVTFDLSFSEKVKIKNNNENWNGNGTLKTSKVVTVRPDKGADDSARGIGLKQFYIWSDYNDRTSIEVEFKKSGQDFDLTKIIPKDYLDSATYPVFTDDALSFNPDADAESTSVDGYIRTWGSYADWGLIHDPATGQEASSSSAGATGFGIGDNTTWTGIYRGVFLFDTSSLSGGTVTAGTFKYYCTSKTITTWNLNFNLYSSNPASNTTLATTDYDYNDFGTTVFNTVAHTGSGIATTSYNTYTLNANGIANVNASGISKFSVLAEADATDTAPARGGLRRNWINIYFAEQGSNEPQLDITYTPAGWSGITTVGGVDVTTITTIGGIDPLTITSFGGVATGL